MSDQKHQVKYAGEVELNIDGWGAPPEFRLVITTSDGKCQELACSYTNDTEMLLDASRLLGTPEGIAPSLASIVPGELKHLIVPQEAAV